MCFHKPGALEGGLGPTDHCLLNALLSIAGLFVCVIGNVVVIIRNPWAGFELT